MPGIFISFEGIDGCGKSTQLERVAREFEQHGREVIRVREPGGTPLGEAIRALLLDDHTAKIDARAEALLFAASRAQLVSDVIRPALAAGAVVLADRFIDSTLAYQGHGRGLPDIAVLNGFATAGLIPHATFFLDLPLDIARQRRAGEAAPDRIEHEDDEFFARVREGFRAAARAEPARIHVVDASGSADAVHERIQTVVGNLVGTRA